MCLFRTAPSVHAGIFTSIWEKLVDNIGRLNSLKNEFLMQKESAAMPEKDSYTALWQY